uniref:CFAP91 domain-containing protein n=1 Tax=Loa loa TaxID=7209 RepID=A0A1I7VJF6_LOALO
MLLKHLERKSPRLFKRGPAHLDYPTSGPYDGPLASTSLAWDVEGEPLQQHVSVYHKWTFDEPMTKIVEIPTEISLEEVPVWSFDEFVPMEEKKPSVDVGEVFTDAAQHLERKITGLSKEVPLIWIIQHQAHMMDRWLQQALHGMVEGEPLQQHEVPVVEKPTVTAKIITGLFKKDETYLDYPAMETYEGPVDSIYRIQDVESEPIEHLSLSIIVVVPMNLYRWKKKPSVDHLERKSRSFQKRSRSSGLSNIRPYDGPLASTSLAWDVEGEPLQQHVSVYHSGRSDEPMTKIVEIPTEISLEEVPVVENQLLLPR